MTLVETLADLVRIDSRSSRPNASVIDYAAARVEALGMRVRLLPYEDERGVEKVQMLAVAPAATSDNEVLELVFVGHTDTVPFDPAWSEALALTEREGNLYGRGACDTKGFIAAALTAAAQASLARLVRPFAIVLTADEEVGCLGAKRLADERVFRARHAVVGEPTSLRPMRAGKGYCLAEVVLRGREGHSAYPHLGASAITRAARLVTRVESIAEELKGETHAAFDPPYTTVNVGLISGGTAKNIIAGECRFTLEWRPIPGQRGERFLELLDREVRALRSADEDFDCEVRVIRLDSGTETRADAPLVEAMEIMSGGAKAGTVSFGTEAPQMQELGADAVVFGPGDIRVAHRTGEFVPHGELQTCVSILTLLIERFCVLTHPYS
ncbi:MAG TPA: acetylornithine deacetylase [Pyrinomonadaceae bacterium]|nr:acetylornithine deacetylase [Pyrinomonadaceae bacterium]